MKYTKLKSCILNFSILYVFNVWRIICIETNFNLRAIGTEYYNFDCTFVQIKIKMYFFFQNGKEIM